MFQEFQNSYYKVLQNVIAKCDRYYKVRQNLLQSVTRITKCDKRLLQSAIGITKCDSYCKVRGDNFHCLLCLPKGF